MKDVSRATLGPLIVLAIASSCRSPDTVIESGAALLQVKCSAGAKTPDELRIWAYDDSGVLWSAARAPEKGALSGVRCPDLGTIMLKPGALQGALRIHVRGFAGGAWILEGVLTLTAPFGNHAHDFLLRTDALPDADGDGVPDAIDNCPTSPNPKQGTCSPSLIEGEDVDSGTATNDADAMGANDGGAATRDGSAPVPDLAVETGTRDLGNDAIATNGPDTSDLAIFADLPFAAEVVDLPTDPPALVDPETEAGAEAQPDIADADIETPQHDDGTPLVGDSADAFDTADLARETTDSRPDAGPDVDDASSPPDVGPDASDAIPDGEAQRDDARPLGNGDPCTAPNQCASGFCKDSVCCKEACTDPCQSCTNGKCMAVRLRDDIPECTGTQTCNLWGSCVAR